MWKHALMFVSALAIGGCMKQAQAVMGPDPDQVGTSSCREIVESCDAECTDPICVNKCTEQGTREAQPQHNALVECAQRNGCADQPCIQEKCPNEVAACFGPEPAPAAAPVTEPPADSTGSGSAS